MQNATETQPDTGKGKGSLPEPGVSDYMAGENKAFVRHLSPYLPPELIGGNIPHVLGVEDESVWNAASQACGTEKVHFCYSIDKGKIWYLATPSSSLASNPDSWCPLAAALPGNSEFWDTETVYLYEQEGLASALRWDQDTGRMQVFLGASRTILPRLQTMDANFVTVNPEAADIVAWKNRSLKTEQLSRATARTLLFTALFTCLIIAGVLAYSIMSINFMKRDLFKIKQDTDRAAVDLMLKAARVTKNDSIKHMVNIQYLLDKLASVNGTLVRYEVKETRLEWEALIPQAFSEEFRGVQVLNLEADGRVRIKGNSI
jgi:hypothetical protein